MEPLNKRVDISVSETNIQDFVRAVANLSGLKINVSPQLSVNLVNKFTNGRVADLLSFLCEQYNLKIKFTGNIVNLYKEQVPYIPREPKVEYLKDSALISLDVQSITLSRVCRKITEETGVNLIPSPDMYNSSAIQNQKQDDQSLSE